MLPVLGQAGWQWGALLVAALCEAPQQLLALRPVRVVGTQVSGFIGVVHRGIYISPRPTGPPSTSAPDRSMP